MRALDSWLLCVRGDLAASSALIRGGQAAVLVTCELTACWYHLV